ncbi:Flagellar C1a complex subunit C1a-32 [Carpediemonas membranifera]|uniref:Flagellar C1a complex subunit C1a-32 n=1 Tax=Carpediemonas membranifera TaxID=201153 RepID=A0A8J6E1A3_9EUKA|nr:Flagellar C1a complex subunit C1a-32 [Carpediemonas membranifera]|eukprot:KAG9393218.1 Flagellar C1a complex subunit C1a-32 [Carpediemonas membranifera]
MSGEESKFLLGKFITREHYDYIIANDNWSQIVSPIIPEKYAPESPQALVFAELVNNSIRFCLDQNYSFEKLSTFVGVMLETHARSMVPHTLARTAQKTFNDLMMMHSVHRPPFSIQVFAPSDLAEVTDFFVRGYMRAFKLYLYVFTPRPVLDLVTQNVGIEFPVLKPEPLAKATMEVEPEPEEEPEDEEEAAEEDQTSADQVISDVVDQMAEQGGVDKEKLRVAIKEAMEAEMAKFKAEITAKLQSTLAPAEEPVTKEKGKEHK